MSTSIRQGFCGAVGKTPMIRIKTLSDLTGCDILGKAEFLNPGGSVKDRAALAIIEDAEAKGLLVPGGTIVEGTAGNTGIGLAHVANAKGYKTIIVIPDTQSQEKVDFMRCLGAEVHVVPAAPYKDPQNYNHIARQIAIDTPGAYWANQFDNTVNRQVHERTTGPEIWEQTQGRVDGFVSVVGTGGTLAGTSTFLKSKKPTLKVALADPHGAAMWSWFTRGNLDFSDGSSITEGVGQNRVTRNIADAPVDYAYRLEDQPIIEMVHFLLRHEGLFLGSSSGLNVLGAVLLAKELGKGHVITTILCDGGARYLSRLFNTEWLATHGLEPVATGLEFLDSLKSSP